MLIVVFNILEEFAAERSMSGALVALQSGRRSTYSFVLIHLVIQLREDISGVLVVSQ